VAHRSVILEIAIFAALQRNTEPKSGKSIADDILAVAEKYRAAGCLNKAETSLRKNLRTDPQNSKSLHILGLIARDRGRHNEAIVAQARVIELLPKSALAWSNHGSALTAAYRNDEAIASFTKALLLEPNGAEFHFNHGNAMHAKGDLAGAEAAFVRTLDLSPYHVGALENLSCVLKERGRLGEAEDSLRSACALYPELTDLRWNHALALLMSENYQEGWIAYDARRAIPGFAIREQTLPPWAGSDLAGRTLLAHAEQGFGDTIQFCRYIHQFADQDGDIVFQVPSRLIPLLRSLNCKAEITDSPKAAARCDVRVPLLSLAHLLGPRAPFWPESGAYVTPESDRLTDWKDKLAGDLAGQTRLTIAIAWQGDPRYQADKTRSIPLAAFAPLADLPTIRLIRLQQGPGCPRIETFAERDSIVPLGETIDQDGAFLDSAAILANIDLMITSDTALAHLAGALNVPTWLALSKIPDWRWGIQGDTSVWYPSMRLFRRFSPGDWGPVFNSIAISLKEKLA